MIRFQLLIKMFLQTIPILETFKFKVWKMNAFWCSWGQKKSEKTLQKLWCTLPKWKQILSEEAFWFLATQCTYKWFQPIALCLVACKQKTIWHSFDLYCLKLREVRSYAWKCCSKFLWVLNFPAWYRMTFHSIFAQAALLGIC